MAALKSQLAQAPVFMPGDGCAMIVTDKYTVAANPTIGDTIDFRIPGGMEVTDVYIQTDDLDTNGAPTIAYTVGYSPIQAETIYTEDLTYFSTAALGVTSKTGGRLSCVFKPKKFNEDVWLRVKFTAAAATFAAGDIIAIVHGNAKGVS